MIIVRTRPIIRARPRIAGSLGRFIRFFPWRCTQPVVASRGPTKPPPTRGSFSLEKPVGCATTGKLPPVSCVCYFGRASRSGKCRRDRPTSFHTGVTGHFHQFPPQRADPHL